MPKNTVNDPITDKEMAFARLVLSGIMTDQQAAKTVGLNPHTAAYMKSKPSVRAYMLEHRARMQEQLAQQQAEHQRRASTNREQILARLWEIANTPPEATRGSLTNQMRALSMLAAIEGLIPGHRAGVPAMATTPAAAPPTYAEPYAAVWASPQETANSQQEEYRGDPPAEATYSEEEHTPGEPAYACAQAHEKP